MIIIYFESKRQKERKNIINEDIILKVRIQDDINKNNRLHSIDEMLKIIPWNESELKFQRKLYETSINSKYDAFKDPLNPYDNFNEDIDGKFVTLHRLSKNINKDLHEDSHFLSNFGIWKVEWSKNKNQRDANAGIIGKFRDDLSDEEYKNLCLQIMPFCKRKKRTLDFISKEILSSDLQEEQNKVDELFNCLSTELESIDRPDLYQNPKIKCREYWLKHLKALGLNLESCELSDNSKCF